MKRLAAIVVVALLLGGLPLMMEAQANDRSLPEGFCEELSAQIKECEAKIKMHLRWECGCLNRSLCRLTLEELGREAASAFQVWVLYHCGGEEKKK